MADKPSLIIRRPRKIIAAGHHGGAWKVAYADFVTAMMALFMVLWLMAATTTKQRVAISEYFRSPNALKGAGPTQGMQGPGGASTSMIKLGGTMDMAGSDPNTIVQRKQDSAQEQRRLEKRRLDALMQQLREAAEKSQALAPFKDQLLLDLTSEGLRVQIVDKHNRLMFDIGSAHLKDYTVELLHELAKLINQVPNHISISGHTDVTAYSSEKGYSNWELSADRANAARRALVEGGMDDTKVVRVVGLSSSVLFDKVDPYNPINRRISIVVMTDDAKNAVQASSGQTVTLNDPAPTATGNEDSAADASGASAGSAAAMIALTSESSGSADEDPASATAAPSALNAKNVAPDGPATDAVSGEY